MSAYYNEFKPEAAHMLRGLIKDGLIADGEVDERSITDVKAEDLIGFTQCHFFAGIGGWSVALRLAGWPDDRPVWTGSCPCQPFSIIGEERGEEDERHLWPVWDKLVEGHHPNIIFGEQVANAISHGWLDGVFSDLEAKNYSCGAAVLPACSVNAPHKRERLFFVGHSERERLERHGGTTSWANGWKEQRRSAPAAGFWDDTEWVAGAGGKQRRTPSTRSGICLVGYGLQHRAPLLHVLGNAIVPEVAARFIQASM